MGSASVLSAEGMTPLDVARLKLVGGAHVSPDGGYIAYTVSEPRDPSASDFENGKAKNILHLYNTKTGQDRVFIGSDDKMGSVHWSADSSRLFFLSKRDGDEHTALYSIPVDGGEARRVLSYQNGISTYTLAPDGRRVAFVATEAEDKEKKKLKDKGFNQEIFEEEWRNARIFVTRLEADTKDLEPLPVEGHVSSVHWSPKAGDDRLLIVKAKDPSVDASLMYRRAHIVSTGGQELTTIANPGKLGELAWSPDAGRVALVAGVDINDPDDAVLFVADSKTGAMKALTAGEKGRVDTFSWKSNDSVLAAMSFGVDSKLMNVSVGGKLTAAPSDPQLNYLGVDVAKNGAVAVVADSATHPRELFYNGKRLTDSNPWLKSRQLAKQSVVML